MNDYVNVAGQNDSALPTWTSTAMPPSAALPLSTPSKSQTPKANNVTAKDKSGASKSSSTAANPAISGEISSPHELTAFVGVLRFAASEDDPEMLN